jgi:UDP-glucose 4-epimerase
MLLIIGGTGFLARHLCVRLHQRALPAATISFNPSLSFLNRWAPSSRGIQVDSAEAHDAFRDAEVVVHLAHRSRPASHIGAPEVEIQSNVADAIGLFRSILDVNPKCHIVFASSGGQIYGAGHSTPIPESAPTAPTTPYSLGKSMIEHALAYFERVAGTSTTILRIANPVGRWQLDRSHGFVAAAVRAAHSNEPLTVYGDGGNYRDYFDVDDLAELLTQFADPAFRKTGIYNIGSGIAMRENDVLKLVERVMGRAVPFRYDDARRFDLRYAVLDVTKAQRTLGWRATTSLDETIGKLAASLH